MNKSGGRFLKSANCLEELLAGNEGISVEKPALFDQTTGIAG
jgi:hypothetical protein